MPPPLVWALTYLHWLPPPRSLSISPRNSCHHGYTSPQQSVTSLPHLPCSPLPFPHRWPTFLQNPPFFHPRSSPSLWHLVALPDGMGRRPLMSTSPSLCPHCELQSRVETVYLSLNSDPAAAAEMALRPHYSLQVSLTFLPCNNKSSGLLSAYFVQAPFVPSTSPILKI